jgi:hypothetical protein
MRTVHTYGDSHATHHGGWTKINIKDVNIKTNHLPGKLAYSFGRDKLQVVRGVKHNDIVVFCFGEIDCRCHINKYEPDWQSSIDSLVKAYLENVKTNLNGMDSVTTCIYNVVPPLEREDPVNFAAERGSGVPAAGTDKDRQMYTVYMNKKLEETCNEYGYTFFNVYDKYCDEKGFINVGLSDNNCHIRDPRYMTEFLVNNILNKK